MKALTEKLGVIFGGISVLSFWIPPYGLAFGVTGLVISLVHLKQGLRFAKTAITLSVLGITFFVAFWGMIWVLSQ
jgi:hypothetical protein